MRQRRVQLLTVILIGLPIMFLTDRLLSGRKGDRSISGKGAKAATAGEGSGLANGTILATPPVHLSTLRPLFAPTVSRRLSTSGRLGSITALSSVEDSKPNVQNDYARLPLSFEANEGQTDGRVRFLARGRGYGVFLTGDEVVVTLRKFQPEMGEFGELGFPRLVEPFSLVDPRAGYPSRIGNVWKSPWRSLIPDLSSLVAEPNEGKRDVATGAGPHSPGVVRMQLVGGNAKGRIIGLDELPGRSNYLIGNDPKRWHSNVPSYSKVKFQNVYPGIDLLYYGDKRQLEYDLEVAPGADPSQIKLSFGGVDRMRVDAASGDLVLQVGDDEVRFHKPTVFQRAVSAVLGSGGSEQNGALKTRANSGRPDSESRTSNLESLSGTFQLASNNQVSFRVTGYDSRRRLVIDPVLSYSTYLGGSGYDLAQGIAVDAAGNAYITGDTVSSDFPTAKPLQPGLGGGTSDAFVAKLNSAGSALVYSTYLGGNARAWATGIAVDSSGNAYVAGKTTSTDFPTANAFQKTNKATLAARCTTFVAKLNSAGTDLVYSTYLGGSLEDWSHGIAVDSSGHAYVTGSTVSVDFPIVKPLQAVNKATPKTGSVTAFVAKLSSTGSAMVYSTYLGGSGGESGQGIAVDPSGNAYLTGYTFSTDFPTVKPLQANDRGDFDAFVAKLNAAGSALVYSTYLGGSSVDYGYGIAVDSFGNAYVTGRTYSTDFPTADPLQPSYGGDLDAFVAKLNAAGSALVYSTYLGGSRYDEGNGIAVDFAGNAYVTGLTYSSNFPTANAFQPTCGGCGSYADAFVTKLNAAGSALVYSTYLGGGSDEYGYGIALDSAGNPYVTGQTSSTDYPTVNPLQPNNRGSFDAFVTKIAAPGTKSKSR
jgi:hypothetical protein